jgi:hypothetical protein
MAHGNHRYVAITPRYAALCAVFGALAAAALTVAVQDGPLTTDAAQCGHHVAETSPHRAALPSGVGVDRRSLLAIPDTAEMGHSCHL